MRERTPAPRARFVDRSYARDTGIARFVDMCPSSHSSCANVSGFRLMRESTPMHCACVTPIATIASGSAISVASTKPGEHFNAMKSDTSASRRARSACSSGKVRAIQNSPSADAIRNCGSISSPTFVISRCARRKSANAKSLNEVITRFSTRWQLQLGSIGNGGLDVRFNAEAEKRGCHKLSEGHRRRGAAQPGEAQRRRGGSERL
jgi:hypothetical protein